MNEDYVAGFMAKAAELGVDPQALVKQGAPPSFASSKGQVIDTRGSLAPAHLQPPDAPFKLTNKQLELYYKTTPGAYRPSPVPGVSAPLSAPPTSSARFWDNKSEMDRTALIDRALGKQAFGDDSRLWDYGATAVSPLFGHGLLGAMRAPEGRRLSTAVKGGLGGVVGTLGGGAAGGLLGSLGGAGLGALIAKLTGNTVEDGTSVGAGIGGLAGMLGGGMIGGSEVGRAITNRQKPAKKKDDSSKKDEEEDKDDKEASAEQHEYAQGFMNKCAELGVDPQALIKLSDDDPLAATKILGGTGAALGGTAGGGLGYLTSELDRIVPARIPGGPGRTLPKPWPKEYRASFPDIPEGAKPLRSGGYKKPRNLKHAILMTLLGAGVGAVGGGVPGAGLGGLIDVARS